MLEYGIDFLYFSVKNLKSCLSKKKKTQIMEDSAEKAREFKFSVLHTYICISKIISDNTLK